MKNHDNRLAPRFAIHDGGAVMVLQNLIFSHSLLDVSESGLAFSYSVGVEHANWIGEERKIDIFGEGFIISEIPVRIIYDKPFDDSEIGEPFNGKKHHLRRCGVQFSTLNFQQKNNVDSYIESLEIMSTLEN